MRYIIACACGFILMLLGYATEDLAQAFWSHGIGFLCFMFAGWELFDSWRRVKGEDK